MRLSTSVRDRYESVRARASGSTAGSVQRRVKELEITNHALILAALTLTLFIPALVSLAAVLPVGREQGLATDAARNFGLSGAAAADVQQLFNTGDTVRGSTTVLSCLVTLLFAYGWPAELARGYALIWDLPNRGWQDRWRPFVWLLVFLGLLATFAASGTVTAGAARVVLTVFLGLPLAFLWSLWTQHLLLGGRVAWHRLVPGAVATVVGLLGLAVGMSIFLSNSVVTNFDRYGPIGVVFVMMSWMLAFSIVMLGGPMAGHIWTQRHGPEARASDPV